MVLDTNIFVNPAGRDLFGNSPTEAFQNLLSVTERKIVELYIPPVVFEELARFIELEKIPGNLLLRLRQKSPARWELSLPAFFIYEFVGDLRQRINKGLRISEMVVRRLIREDIREEAAIGELREKYRTALREGPVDSKEDVDLLLLARELAAGLVTLDQGLRHWAEKLGIPCLSPYQLKQLLKIDKN